jgi:hypothetical protein
MVMALGKSGKLCRVPCHSTRQKFLKKHLEKLFAECSDVALGKEGTFAECQAAPLDKYFFKKKTKFLCRVPCRGGTQQIFFEKNIKNSSAKCPSRHSAKALSTE